VLTSDSEIDDKPRPELGLSFLVTLFGMGGGAVDLPERALPAHYRPAFFLPAIRAIRYGRPDVTLRRPFAGVYRVRPAERLQISPIVSKRARRRGAVFVHADGLQSSSWGLKSDLYRRRARVAVAAGSRALRGGCATHRVRPGDRHA